MQNIKFFFIALKTLFKAHFNFQKTQLKIILKSEQGASLLGVLTASSIGFIVLMGLVESMSKLSKGVRKGNQSISVLELRKDIRKIATENVPFTSHASSCTNTLAGIKTNGHSDDQDNNIHSYTFQAEGTFKHAGVSPGAGSIYKVYKDDSDGSDIYFGSLVINEMRFEKDVPDPAPSSNVTARTGKLYISFLDRSRSYIQFEDITPLIVEEIVYDGSDIEVISSCKFKLDNRTDFGCIEVNLNGLTLIGCGTTEDIPIDKTTAYGYGIGFNPYSHPLAPIGTFTGAYNSFFGYKTANKNDSAEKNSFFGYLAGHANFSGNNNTVFGFAAGRAISIGSNNSFFGYKAGEVAGWGNRNTIFGFQAGRLFAGHNIGASENSFFGFRAGLDSRGDQNIFIGAYTNYKGPTTAGAPMKNNIAVGYQAGYELASKNNILFGYQAGYILKPYHLIANTFLGHKAGYQMGSPGERNAFIGEKAGYNSRGIYNTFFGKETGYESTNAHNFFIGAEAGKKNQGDKNNFIGNKTGLENTGRHNYFIGNLTGQNNTGDYNYFIGESTGGKNTGFKSYFFGKETGYEAVGTDHYFIGKATGKKSSGSRNHFIGHETGLENTGIDNYFIGRFTGQNNTGEGNYFIGEATGGQNEGNHNYFIGGSAGKQNKGAYNFFLGYKTGLKNEGEHNLFLGSYSGQNNKADKSLFIGSYSGQANTTGDKNSFIGVKSGQKNTTGNENVFFGKDAGLNNTDGDKNTFIGLSSGNNNITGNENTYLGWQAKGGDNSMLNTILGTNAGTKTNLGDKNVFIGSLAGHWMGEGEFNVMIGHETSFGKEQAGCGDPCSTWGKGNNNILIGAGQILDPPYTRNHEIHIGNNSHTSLKIGGSSLTNVKIGGSSLTDVKIGSYNLTILHSSKILKKNIQTFENYDLALKDIMETPLSTYQYKNSHPDHTRRGFIAEDLPQHLQLPPEEDSTLVKPDWASIWGGFWASIKALAFKFENLKAEMSEKWTKLVKRLSYLKTMLYDLKKSISLFQSDMTKTTKELKAKNTELKRKLANTKKELAAMKTVLKQRGKILKEIRPGFASN